MTTPPSDPYETPGQNRPPQQPRYGETPPPYPGPPPTPYEGQTPPGQYEQAPGYPPFGQPAAKPEPPSPILRAVRLMYAGAILSLLWTVLVLPQRDVLRDAMDDQNLEMTQSELDTLVNAMLGVMIVVGLFTVGLWILMARANRDGKAWARVFATVLGAIGILVGLAGLFRADSIALVMNLALVVLSGWILWLLYRRESTEYYNAVSQRPRY